MKLKQLLAISLLGSCITTYSYADKVFTPNVVNQADVSSYFHKLLPTTEIDKIYTTPYPDTYALLVGQGIIYGNLHSKYLMVGYMFDVSTHRNLTDELVKLNTPKLDISKIDVSDAVVVKAPTKVNKKLIVFVDPDCPYCRELESQLVQNKINEKADIYYMLMPLPMHPNAKEHVKNILCAEKPNSRKVLEEYMLNNNDTPQVKLVDGCNIDAVLERTGSTARNLGINGTPAIVTGDGTMIMGMDIGAINQYLNAQH